MDVVQTVSLAAIAVVLGYALSSTNLLKHFLGSVPISHKVAIIGLPGAGKTSLITALFEIIQNGGARKGVRIHGAKTIALINRYIARLASGLNIGPTHEGDVFLFRFSYNRERFLQTLVYDVEIADFPGEYSDSLEQNRLDDNGDLRMEDFERETLLRREFISWIASSSRFVFVIDLSAIYTYIAPGIALNDIIARVRTSWQIIEDAVSDRGIGTSHRRPIHIVFTKLDALIPLLAHREFMEHFFTPPSENSDEPAPEKENLLIDLRENIRREGGRQNLSPQLGINEEGLSFLRTHIERHFADLFRFFASQRRSVAVDFISLRIKEENGRRLGVGELLGELLP